jgi:hypothetical protein
MKTSIFDFINSINNKKRIEYDKKDLSGYMLSLWLSHDKECIFYVNELNKYLFNIKDEYIYEYYFNKIPKKKRFIKYIKKTKEKKDYLQIIMNKYNISRNEAKKFKSVL